VRRIFPGPADRHHQGSPRPRVSLVLGQAVLQVPASNQGHDKVRFAIAEQSCLVDGENVLVLELRLDRHLPAETLQGSRADPARQGHLDRPRGAEHLVAGLVARDVRRIVGNPARPGRGLLQAENTVHGKQLVNPLGECVQQVGMVLAQFLRRQGRALVPGVLPALQQTLE
jgi:hypothetical protein